MIKSLSITIVSLVLLLTSCGQQHEAEALVEDFMDKNMKDEVSINARRFTDIDSTFLLTNDVIQKMRNKAANGGQRYKKGIKYADGNPTRKLFITRVKYYVDTLECSDTYYLNADLTHIVAFKEN
ncbi:hypothetical protein CIK96_06030 [Prevotella sp. P4-98]|uniref:hypothetical protein n=1 Tax=Prevotella sp. P4-98 TaxID=2024219 RepID=UPI000B97946A|nr:hypothetical protein [Prevotella sp. P4-98]OYP46408.1 hypothetical protein CIK96_06030 [Prevotella sp. P4-98]